VEGKMSKLLFILKRREDFNAKIHNKSGLSTGLYNSAKFMNDMMIGLGVESVMEVAIDNNCIDRLITLHKPTHVIIEALWVVPTKFSILTKLHPNVKWIIRLHSEMPFMAGEGMAMDWLGDYAKFKNIVIACNAPRMMKEIQLFLGKEKVIYLPNFYPQTYKRKKLNKDKYWVDVCCFGAVRLLKNHLIQAYAAIEFAEKIGKQLRFHINAGRIEMQGGPVQNNLKGLFQHLHGRGHELINHQWTPREEFLELCSEMDIGLQCNFSETFNIVGADLTSQGIPLVGSSEIPWSASNADPTESGEICDALIKAYKHPQLNVLKNQYYLKRYTNKTRKIWYKYFL
jgi:hypothetical protein